MAGTYLTRPKPQLVIIGWEDTAAISGSVALALPDPSFETSAADGFASIALTAKRRVLDAAGTTGTIGEAALGAPLARLAAAGLTGMADVTVDMVRPALQLAIAGSCGFTGEVLLSAPVPTWSVLGRDVTALARTMPELAAIGATGLVGSVARTMPAPQLAITGLVQFAAGVALARSMPRIDAVGVTGTIGAVALGRPVPGLALVARTGVIGAIVLDWPVPASTQAGTALGRAQLAQVLPLPLLAISGRQSAGATFATLAMQAETLALSTYENYPFNAFARFNGTYLGASAGGVYVLTGANDAGTAIAARVQLGKLDFSTSHMKRVDRCYVGYRADGDMALEVVADEGTATSYPLAANSDTSLHGARVVLAKGVSGRYWQFSLANTAGAGFSLDALEAAPAMLARRVKVA